MTTYNTLSEANRARQKEWDPGGQISLAYRGNELAGEAGEACNVIKKLERERLGIRGSRSTVKDLEEELGDVWICCELIAMQLQCTCAPAGKDTFNPEADVSALGCLLAHKVGVLCGRMESRWPSSAAEFDISQVLSTANEIARRNGINLDAAVRRKFNATSEKYGLQTRVAEPQVIGEAA